MIVEVKIVLETLIKPLFCNLELEMSPVTIHDSVSSRWTGALSSVRTQSINSGSNEHESWRGSCEIWEASVYVRVFSRLVAQSQELHENWWIELIGYFRAGSENSHQQINSHHQSLNQLKVYESSDESWRSNACNSHQLSSMFDLGFIYRFTFSIPVKIISYFSWHMVQFLISVITIKNAKSDQT
jgi:hypothetical protein